MAFRYYMDGRNTAAFYYCRKGELPVIQDISPEIYDNSFEHRRAPQNDDPVLMYREGCVLACLDGKSIRYPSVAQVIHAVSAGNADNMHLPLYDEQTEVRGIRETERGDRYYISGIEFIFLFKIDETAFFGIDNDRIIAAVLDSSEDLAEVKQTELRAIRPMRDAYTGITGLQLQRWRDTQRFCGKCGGKMRPSRTERAYICDSCGLTNYPKISPAVIVAVTHGSRILLTKYAGRTYTRYALIAGFAEVGETIEETVHREVMEEVGVKVKNLRFYKSQPWSFSDSLLFGFFCELDGEEHITLDTRELASGEFLTREEMPDRSDDISLTAEMMELFRTGGNK